MEQIEQAEQAVLSEEATGLSTSEGEPAGEAALGLALFAEVAPIRAAPNVAPPAARSAIIPTALPRWAGEPALWGALGLAAVLRLWRLEHTPAALGVALGVALASVLGVGIAYLWARRNFGWEVALTSAALFAVWGLAVASGRSGASLGLVPPLLALWALMLFTGSATGQALWLLTATLVLVVTSLLLPAAGVLALTLLLADLLLPAPERPAPGRELRTVALVGLPLIAAAWGTTLRMPADAPLAPLPWPAPLGFAALGICIVGWLALSWLVLSPVGGLRRWYALASDPRERRAAIWAGLRADPRWRALILLWLSVSSLALALPAFPARATELALLPMLLALPGMAAVWLRARAAPRWLPALWLGVVGLLALALAVAAVVGIA